MDQRVYTKRQMDNILTNRPIHQALFDLHIVPKALARVVEIELDDGFVLAKSENIIQTQHRFGEGYIIKKIEEQRPDIMCAVDSTFVDEIPFGKMIYGYLNPPPPPQLQERDICYSCSS